LISCHQGEEPRRSHKEREGRKEVKSRKGELHLLVESSHINSLLIQTPKIKESNLVYQEETPAGKVKNRNSKRISTN
jgi:hypothetical protein